jgi:ribosomal protein S18 acetylase RimI-like enzyme
MQRIDLRPVGPEDEAFLYRVYASTRQDELALVPWGEAEKEAFLQMQFAAQHTFYRERFAGASFDLILLNGQPVGRLYLDRRPNEVRIIDIALLAEYRRQGIGTHLLRDILDEAGRAGLPVRIHVEQNNPALGLYHRLGFRQIGDEGIYYLMEWSPRRSPDGVPSEPTGG